MNSLLNYLGYEVLLAKDGTEARDIYRQHHDHGRQPDAVLLDLTIPGGMGGLETAGHLLRTDPNAKIIVSSGYSHDPVMEQFRDYGFSAIASKPYRLAELSEIVSSIVGSHQQR